MPTLHVINTFYIVVLFLVIQTAHGIDYGPSLTSLTGVYVNWKGPSLLALEAGKKVVLESFPNYAVVIPLTTGSSSATSQQIFQERVISTVGEFLVEAPKGYGVMAVIQELSLRRNTLERRRGAGPCSDYIQFGDGVALDGPGKVTGPICGQVKKGDPALRPRGLIGPRSFYSPSGRMRMVFNHAYVSELVDSLISNYEHGDPRRNPLLKVEVAFTAYNEDCTEEDSTNAPGSTDLPIEQHEQRELRICTNYASNRTCISSRLFCDDILHCAGEPGDSDLLGMDESYYNCPTKPSTTTTSTDKNEPLEVDDDEEELPPGRPIFGIGRPYESIFTEPRKNSSGSASSSGSNLYNFYPRTSTQTSVNSDSDSVNNELDNRNPLSTSTSSHPKESVKHSSSDYEFSESNPPSLFNRMDITNAISSVIYGVAIFIIFTIFVTVSFVCISKRIQESIAQRNRSVATTNSTVTPATTTTVITHNTSNGATASGDMAFAPSNTTVVLLTLPQNMENYDPPPAYESLFPSRTP